jgi:YrbI family 3-deoxy-D-manno-octulosonate 8-phosphate phosphatase
VAARVDAAQLGAGTRRGKEAVTFEERLKKLKLVAFDFDGVLTDNSVYVFEDGREAVRCSRGDSLGLGMLAAAGVHTVIISKETNPVVTARAKKMKMRCIQNCDDKRTALEGLANELGLSMDEIAFVGNDVNDIPCLEIVGMPMVVADAHEDVLRYAAYRTTKVGGNGAVREICDLIMAVQRS